MYILNLNNQSNVFNIFRFLLCWTMTENDEGDSETSKLLPHMMVVLPPPVQASWIEKSGAVARSPWHTR